MKHARSSRHAFIAVLVTVFVAPLAGCGGEPQPDEAAPTQSAGEEQPAQPRADAAAQQEQQDASERAMDEVVELSMQLGSQRAALAKQLDKPRPDCERSEVLRDRICETAASICSISEQEHEAVGHCDRSTGKCERAKRDVDELRCRRRGRKG